MMYIGIKFVDATYSNTNKLGKAIAEFAAQNYQHRLTTEEGWLEMAGKIREMLNNKNIIARLTMMPYDTCLFV